MQRLSVRRFSMVHAIGSRFSTEGNRLTSLIESHVAEIPTKNVLNFQKGQRLAIQDLSVQSRALGAGLAGLRYGNDHTILLVLPNTIDRINLQLAAAYAGCKVAVVDGVDDTDIAACLKNTKARGLFVPARLVPKVRAAVPELTLAGLAKDSNPRYFDGHTTEAKPIGSVDFPHLKQVFQTGAGREPRIHLLKHLPLYYPIPNPLAKVKPLSETTPFFSVLSEKGDVVKSYSREDLLKQADQVATKLSLKPDESVLLATKQDPHSTLVGLLACASTWSQLIIPDLKETPQSLDAFVKTENVAAAIGDINVPSSVGSRVVKL